MQSALRQPPPLVLVWTQSRFWRGLQAMLAALCLCGLLAWAHSHRPGLGLGLAGWPPALVAPAFWLGTLLLGLGCLLAVWRLLQRPPWRLRFDGQSWYLADAGGASEQAIELQGAQDWGNVLLLQWRPQRTDGRAATRWRYEAIDAASAGAQWHGLRVALYCRSR